MKVNFIRLVLIVVIGMALPALLFAEVAPDFTLKDQEGKALNLSDLKGKTVVLEWLNPDCPFVRRHYKEGTMKSLASRYKDSEVVWVSVNSTHWMGASDNQAFSKKYTIPYRVLDDSSGEVGRKFHARTTPHMFVISPEGKIVYSGAIDDDEHGEKDAAQRTNYVEKALTQSLAGNAVEVSSTKSYGCGVKYKS